jgi:predicted Zn-dependent protease
MIGRPITAIVVREIAGRTTGCSLGISADWVVVQASLFKAEHPLTYDETVLAHEIGHALNLPHHPDRGNLMYYSSSPPNGFRGTALSGWQRALITANRHVVPGLPE